MMQKSNRFTECWFQTQNTKNWPMSQSRPVQRLSKRAIPSWSWNNPFLLSGLYVFHFGPNSFPTINYLIFEQNLSFYRGSMLRFRNSFWNNFFFLGKSCLPGRVLDSWTATAQVRTATGQLLHNIFCSDFDLSLFFSTFWHFILPFCKAMTEVCII